MPDPAKISKSDTLCFVDDGANRGPMTMFRVRFHPLQPYLVAQCVDRRLAVWDLEAEPREVKGRKEPCVIGSLRCPHEIGWIRGFDLHPQGSHLATGGSDRSLRVWSWSEGTPQPLASLTAHQGWVEAVVYSPDGRRLATAGADGLVKIWESDGLKPVDSLSGHSAYASDLTYSPDGKLLASGGEDGWVIVRDAATGEELRRIEFGSANDQFGQNPRHSGVHRLTISSDSRWLAVAGGENLKVFDLESGQVVAEDNVRMDAAWHPGSLVLAGGDSETKIWLCAAAEFQPPELDKNGKLRSPGAIPGKLLGSFKRGEWSLGLQFSPDGKRLALGKADGCVELYDVGW